MSGYDPSPNGYGPVEMRVRLDVGLLGELTGVRAGLAEVAYSLAREIDNGAGMATASIARELRLYLAEITRGPANDDDGTSGVIAGLGVPERAAVPDGGTPVCDTEDMEQADSRPESE